MNRLKIPPALMDRSAAERAEDRQLVGSLSRGLEILRAFDEIGGPLSNQDLVACTGLPKSTVSRITRTLAIEGYLVQAPRDGRFRLAPAVLGLARAFHDANGLAEAARPLMLETAERTRSRIAMGAPDRLDMVYVQTCRTAPSGKKWLAPGSRVALHNTSIGLACLHILPSDERASLMDQIRRQSPRNWPLTAQEIARTGKEMEERGFCVCLGTWTRGINAAGTAIMLPDRSVVAFNIGGSALWAKEPLLTEELGPSLVRMAAEILADRSRRDVFGGDASHPSG